jgi:cell division protein FtsB
VSSNYDDLRQYLETAEKRAHRRTLLATLIPVVAVIALVLVAGSRLIRAKAKLEEANAELKKTNAELNTANENLNAKNTELEQAFDERQKVIDSLTAQIKDARDAEQARKPAAPWVYLQIADEGQRKAVRGLQTDLITSGYVTPGIENVAKRNPQIPEQTEVRYFRDQDRDTAAGVVKQLAQKGIAAKLVREPGRAKKPLVVVLSKNAHFKNQ